MRISIPKEIKAQEGRVALLPRHVKALVAAGHQVTVEHNAGIISQADDDAYTAVGAAIAPNAASVWQAGELVVKVKEVLPPEYPLVGPQHTVFTNIHAALNQEQTDVLLKAGCAAVSAENTHPLGSPNCPLAGEVGAFEGVRLSFAQQGGSGRHFMGHFGEGALRAVVIGLGNVGRGALRTLLGLGVSVVGLDVYEGARKAARLDWHRHKLVVDDVANLEHYIYEADVIYNCVLWPKHRTDHLISRAMLRRLKPRTVIVDISCDTAGAIETSRSTSWAEPTYREEGILHFAVDNIPGAVPVTASAGYGEAILPRLLAIGAHGLVQACRDDAWLARGLTCYGGELILEEAGLYQKRPFTPVNDWLAKAR